MMFRKVILTSVLLTLMGLPTLVGQTPGQEQTSPCLIPLRKNPWMRFLAPEAEIVAVSECHAWHSKKTFVAVVFTEEVLRLDRRLQIFRLTPNSKPNSNEASVSFAFSSEGMGLDFLDCTNPFLVTAWSSGPVFRIVVFAPTNNEVSVILDKRSRGLPELVDLDNDGIDELVIAGIRFREKGELGWYPARAEIYKWKEGKLLRAAETSWEGRFRVDLGVRQPAH